VFRCIICLRTGEWLRAKDDVEEIEKILLETKDIHSLGRGSEAIDIVAPEVPPSAPRKRRKKK
jgi:hypothetical protein